MLTYRAVFYKVKRLFVIKHEHKQKKSANREG